MRVVLEGSPWHNQLMPCDVTADLDVTVEDWNAIAKLLASAGGPIAVPTNPHPNPKRVLYYDVDDNWVVDQADLDKVAGALGGGPAPNSVPPLIFDVNVMVDSDNNEVIDEYDDPVEMDEPGALVRINDNDDNENGIEDLNEVPIGASIDPDLELVLLDHLLGGGILIEWETTLSLDGSAADYRLWMENPADPQGPMQALSIGGTTWNLAVNPPPTHVWLEGLRPAAGILEYSIQNVVTLQQKKDQAIVTSPRVVSVEWRTFSDNRPIDGASFVPNGEDPNGGSEPPVAPGKRIFPERKVYDDAKNTLTGNDREVVEVVATIQPAKPRIPVTFTWWDIDDPSGLHLPVDLTPDGEFPIGGDNRDAAGGLMATYSGGPAYPGQVSVTKKNQTIPPSAVTVYFHVSTRPGDNFKITATNWVHLNSQITQEKVDRDATGDNLLPKGVAVTEMLTTWRTLHVEPDSFGDGSEYGPFDEAGAWVDRPDPNVNWDWNPGNVGEPGNGNAFFQKPSLDWLTVQMARAYVDVAEDLQSYDSLDDAPFVRNTSDFDTTWPDYARDVDSLVDHWTLQVFAGYDATLNDDYDQGWFSVTSAWTPFEDPGIDPLRVPIFLSLETLRDERANKPHAPGLAPQTFVGRVVLHEALHRFGMPHGVGFDQGPLRSEINLTGSDTANAVTAIQVHMIRSWKRP